MTPARGNLRSVKVPEECPADVAHLIEDCLNANNPDDRPTASQIYDRLISRCLPAALLPYLSAPSSLHEDSRDLGYHQRAPFSAHGGWVLAAKTSHLQGQMFCGIIRNLRLLLQRCHSGGGARQNAAPGEV